MRRHAHPEGQSAGQAPSVPVWVAWASALAALLLVVALGLQEHVEVRALVWRGVTAFLSIWTTQRLMLEVLALPDEA